MLKFWPVAALLLASSCGGFLTSGLDLKTTKERQIASVAMEKLIAEEEQSFDAVVDERLFSLHRYYVIAQKYLYQFDESIQEQNLVRLYQGQTYLSIVAARTQIDDIEKDLIHLQNSVSDRKQEILKRKISEFSEKGPLHYRSVENIAHALGVALLLNSKYPDSKQLDKEFRELDKALEFQVYEKNIEHLSHLMEMNFSAEKKTFSPSENENGSFSGQEFPAKVWSITFSNGPTKSTTPEIFENLQKKNLKASFFQEGAKIKPNKSFVKNMIREGMEIGTQSFSNKELSKVGLMTLEKEITVATETMEKALKLDIQFYRLPYASGIEVPQVRQMIAKNNLIHAFWNVDSLDWLPQSPDRIVKRTKDLMKKTSRDSGVILFHDIHPRTVKASAVIMDHLKLEARRVCTLGTIVKEMNQGENSVCSQKSF